MKGIFLGCLSRERYDETCKHAIEIIQKLDEDYSLLEEAPCCGSVNHHIASVEEIKNHAMSVYQYFTDNNITEIITICAGCYNYFTTYYPEILPEFDIKVRHIVQLIAEPENLEKLNLKYSGKKRLTITYHDPCHLLAAEPQIKEEPRIILENIEGKIRYNDMQENEALTLCCGAGGGVYSSFKENSTYNSKFIFDQAKRQRAKILLTSCPFCFTALKKVQEEDDKVRTKVVKFEDFILNLMKEADPLND